jgi:hypothetical protein
MCTPDTTTHAYQYAAAIAAEVQGLEDGELEGYELDGEGPDRAYEAVTTWLSELALDVEVTRNVTTGDVTAVEVTRTVGGPGCYVTFRDRSNAEVVAYWGTDEATVCIPARCVAIVTDVVLDWYAEVFA